MQWRQVWERGAELIGLIAREFGRIPHYHAEGDRLMRAMRNQGHDRQASGRVRIIRREPDRTGKDKAVALVL
ncbi:MAG: hypothetical protein HYU65_01680 [Armatimonadetes bacterium]|nr:hypothetical protein [Armatimonadota bacterium]